MCFWSGLLLVKLLVKDVFLLWKWQVALVKLDPWCALIWFQVDDQRYIIIYHHTYMPYWSVLVVTGLNRAVLVASVMCFQKRYGWHGLKHQIIEYLKKEKLMTDKQTDRQTDRVSSCRLDPFCGRGRVKRSFCNKNISLHWTFVVSLIILLKSKQLLTWFSSWGGEKLADLCSWGPPCWLLHWDRDNQNDEDDYPSHWWWCLSSLLMMMLEIIVDDGV